MSKKLLLLACAIGFPAVAQAAPVAYGDFAGTNVTYKSVTEDSTTDPTPLYGTPAVSGDALSFSPVSFGAFSSNGSIPDLTDGTLAMAVEANSGKVLHALTFSESGDYTLAGPGGPNTKVTLSAPYFVSIIEVNNAPTPGGPLNINGNFSFTPQAAFALPTDAGNSVIWSGSAFINLDAALLANNIAGSATKILFSFDNALFAQSEPGTVAFIKKKALDGLSITVVIPEPASLSLLAGLSLLTRRRR
jgi:hypothetical protein